MNLPLGRAGPPEILLHCTDSCLLRDADPCAFSHHVVTGRATLFFLLLGEFARVYALRSVRSRMAGLEHQWQVDVGEKLMLDSQPGCLGPVTTQTCVQSLIFCFASTGLNVRQSGHPVLNRGGRAISTVFVEREDNLRSLPPSRDSRHRLGRSARESNASPNSCACRWRFDRR